MPGPIFLHFQTYSRKPNPAGNHIGQIIGEALRAPDYSRHIEKPTPPRVLLGTPGTFAQEHEDHVAARATEVRRKGKVHRKAIRQDRHTLATAVASYPLTHEQIAAGGDEAARLHREWERRTLAWMRERYGEQLRVVMAHDDESHPHLHFWMLPNDLDARADTLHPGKVAKREAEAEARAAGKTDREAVKAGDEALKAAMRGVLESYWEEVGAPLGMTRDGPKRMRMTREQWVTRKEEAARQGRLLRRAEQADAVVTAAKARGQEQAAKVLEQANAVAEAAKALAREMEAGTLSLGQDGLVYGQDLDALRPGVKVLKDAIKAAAKAQTAMNERLDSIKAAWAEIRGAIPAVRAVLQRLNTPADERAMAKRARREIVDTSPKLRSLIKRAMEASSPAAEQARPEPAAGADIDGPGM